MKICKSPTRWKHVKVKTCKARARTIPYNRDAVGGCESSFSFDIIHRFLIQSFTVWINGHFRCWCTVQTLDCNSPCHVLRALGISITSAIVITPSSQRYPMCWAFFNALLSVRKYSFTAPSLSTLKDMVQSGEFCMSLDTGWLLWHLITTSHWRSRSTTTSSCFGGWFGRFREDHKILKR